MDPVDQTVEILQKMLAEQELPNNARLPPERELAERCNVTRAQLRRALAVLEAEGAIWRHIGKGTFAGPRPIDSCGSITESLGKSTNPTEIIEARLRVEPQLAAIAALNNTSEDVERMYRAIEKSLAAKDVPTFEMWDGALHRAIAQGTHNKILIAVFDVINGLRNVKLWGQLKEAAATADRREIYTQQHRAIVYAIASRLSDEAAEAMQVHLLSVREHLFTKMPGEPSSKNTGEKL